MFMGHYKALRIENAAFRYIPQIFSLARAYELRQVPPKQSKKLGFLVSDFKEEDYQSFLSHYQYFYVLLEQENVLGFLLAYPSNRIQKHEWLNLQIKLQYPDPFVVIKQICIRPDKVGKGLGKLLYKHLFEKALEENFFAAIVLKPLNYRSVYFHEKLCFKKVFEITPPDFIPRGIWMKKIQRNLDI